MPETTEAPKTITVPAPAPGLTVVFRDKQGDWPAVVRAVNPNNHRQVDLIVFTAMSGAYAGKQALGVVYCRDKMGCWWWPSLNTTTMEV